MNRPSDEFSKLQDMLDRDLEKLIETIPDGDTRRKLECTLAEVRSNIPVSNITNEEIVSRSRSMLAEIESTRALAARQVIELTKINDQFAEVSAFGLKHRSLKVSWWGAALVIAGFLGLLIYAAIKSP
ncbi:MAG: hypothetical protein ACI8WM_001460 [Burkholderiaceae bacterium]|jgi:hypothetical protein